MCVVVPMMRIYKFLPILQELIQCLVSIPRNVYPIALCPDLNADQNDIDVELAKPSTNNIDDIFCSLNNSRETATI
jgi:hypothetical protein